MNDIHEHLKMPGAEKKELSRSQELSESPQLSAPDTEERNGCRRCIDKIEDNLCLFNTAAVVFGLAGVILVLKVAPKEVRPGEQSCFSGTDGETCIYRDPSSYVCSGRCYCSPHDSSSYTCEDLSPTVSITAYVFVGIFAFIALFTPAISCCVHNNKALAFSLVMAVVTPIVTLRLLS